MSARDRVRRCETLASLKRLLRARPLHVIKVETAWCGPCRSFRPTVAALVKKTGLRAYSVDMEKVPGAAEIMKGLRVRAVPTLLWVKDGKVAEKTVGVVGLKDLVKTWEALR